jgi:hypothetical protein
LPFAAGFRHGVPDPVRAKQRGARRSGKGSRVERSKGLISIFIDSPLHLPV